MWMNVPGFWVLWGNDYEIFHLVAIFLTFLLLTIGLYFAVVNKTIMASFELFLNVAVFIEWSCMLF